MGLITNKAGYPEVLVRAVENDSYSRGKANRSVTGLISPARQSALKEIHANEIVEDVSERTWALYGQLIHLLLERAGEKDRNVITEERLFTEVNGWTISGQTDNLTLTEDQASWIITDYKFVTSFKFTSSKVPEDYEQQLNLYAHLLRANGFPVDGLKIVAIYRDWSKLESKRNSNYPQLGAETHDIPLWPADKAKAFREERVRLHQDAEAALPECDASERWARPDKYGLMPNANSARARKLFDSYYEAYDWAKNPTNKMKDGWVIEQRKGANIRCENYCVVSEFCDQFKILNTS